ncbi:MAG: NAD-dependent epimerase/dehydratase family protein [Alphaproteobacteria bacterium]|nr:NAD-dependent epimerase/dehydratase family protein [Alphaproteobacteria bacterium]
MRIFITGGSGFVGGHLIEVLRGEHEVLAMARSDRSVAAVEALGAIAVRTALGQVTPEQLDGVDAIVHAAAFVEEYGTREQFRTVNVEGTRQLLEAAKAAGVKRFIHIGTEAAFFTGPDLVMIDESTPYPSGQRFLYSETKAEAERLVLAANGPGFHTVSLRPRLIWGPRDESVMGNIRDRALKNEWVWLDGGRHHTSTCHVRNLVAAVELALTRGEGGRAYFIADDGERTLREFFDRLLATQGVTLAQRSIPGWLARGASVVVEGTWRGLSLSGTPPLTRFAAFMFSATVTVDTARARQELGYAPVLTVEQGLVELAAG